MNDLPEAIDTIMEGGSSLGIDYDDALEYAMQDALFVDLMHELHGAVSSTQLFIVKGKYCNLLRSKVEFLLVQAEKANTEIDAGLV